jgi:hypothetical protein
MAISFDDASKAISDEYRLNTPERARAFGEGMIHAIKCMDIWQISDILALEKLNRELFYLSDPNS